MDSSDSDIDPEEFKRIYSKLEKKIQQSKEAQNNNSEPKDQNSTRLYPRPRHQQRQRERSRDNVKENVSWHIYQNVDAIDYINLLPQKLQKLPIFKKKNQIIKQILQNQVVLITGDTGCGKSTQVPRLIYEYLKKVGQNDKIICVQPRRLAVTSLKSAVQSQLPDRQRVVGYQIGQKAEFNSSSRIVFMTNGIFLQRITHSPDFLYEYPFVVLDEVHERDIDTDFILTALKRIIRGFPKVRIILMSATIDNELFRYYFASDHIDNFMKEDNFYKKIIEIQEWEKAKNDDELEEEICVKEDSDEEEKKKKLIYDSVAFKFLESRFPCPAININEPSNFNRTYFYIDTLDDFIKREYVKKWGSIHWSYQHPSPYPELYETACMIIDQIRYKCRQKNDLSSQAVLVFLPGLNEIENFSEDVFKFLGGREKVFNEFQLIHVHSTIMTEAIENKINTPNKRQIKLIISTNIAESSITVKGVKYVIDFCLTKEIRYDGKSRMENLELVYSSRASCKQRAGRTGRVCDGYIFRMVDKKFYDEKFEDYSEPEIKRSSLDKLILRIKLMHEKDSKNLFADPPEVLGTCIQPPRLESIQSSIDSLKFCGGLQQHGIQFTITNLGKLYVQIPIDISYTKLLIVSMMFGTFYDALILVSILSQNKNAIHRRDIERNFYNYFDKISNHEYCDFLALVNLFKDEEESRKGTAETHQYNKRNFRENKLNFSIYTETKNTMNDIIKRLERKWFNFVNLADYLEFRDGNDVRLLSKKCHQEKHPKPKYTDYFMRWKLTLAFGFVDKMIVIKPPVYDPKQQKRIRDMKRSKISSERAIVLLNSSVITLPRNANPESTQKTVNHWKNVFRKSINVNLSKLTLTGGLNYLHFDDDIDLNKLLFLKEMDSNVRKRGSGCVLGREDQKRNCQDINEGSFLNVKQLIECLGDIDHIQQGLPYTVFKDERVRIDQHSLNRVCNYVQDAPSEYLLTNALMLQNKYDLVCRYTSVLNIFSFERAKHPNTNLHVLSNLLFYPFVKLRANKLQNEYEYLALKKKHMVKIGYKLREGEIERVNLIREMIKEFFQFRQEMNVRSCSEFYKLVRSFVLKKRKSTVSEINDEMWQSEFLKQVKQGKISPPPVQTITVNLGTMKITNDSELQQNITQSIQHQSILQEMRQQSQQNQGIPPERIVQQQQPQHTIQQQQTRSYETRNFMNPIELPIISDKESYFLKSKDESAQSFHKRMKFYLEWKKSILKEVTQLTKYSLDNDSYLCCGFLDPQTLQPCGLPLCKLKRVGPFEQTFNFRDLFDPIMPNLKLSQEPDSQIDIFLLNQSYQEQYTRYSCSNNHQIGIKNNTSNKIKILLNKSYLIQYPDVQNASLQEMDFIELQMTQCVKEESAAIKRKEKQSVKKSCFLCGFKFTSFQELKQHMKDAYHVLAVDKFQKSIEIGERELDAKEEEEEEEEVDFGEKMELMVKRKQEAEDEPIEIEY